MSVVEFEVLGLPSPQGSKRHVGNGRMVESSKTLATWRDSLTATARDVAGVEPIDEPVKLTVEFRCPMPKSRRKDVIAAGRGPKTTAPDLDKLVRAVGDALEAGGLIRSDALIYELQASKVEVVGWTGAVIRLEMP